MAEEKALISYLDKIYDLHKSEHRRRDYQDRNRNFEDEERINIDDSPEETLRKKAVLEHRMQKKLQKAEGLKALQQDAVQLFGKHPQMKRFKLSAADLDVVAAIFSQTKADFDVEVRASEIIKMTDLVEESLSAKVSFLVSLLDREILSFARGQQNDYHFDIHTVIESNYILNSYFLNLLMGKKPIQEATAHLAKYLAASEQPLQTINMAMKIFFTYYPELKSDLHETDGYYYGKTVQEFMNHLIRQIVKLPQQHLLQEFIAAHKLNDFDLKSLLLIWYFGTELEQRMETKSIANLLARDAIEAESNLRALNYHNVLRTDGLIKQGSSIFFSSNTVEISEKAIAELGVEIDRLQHNDLDKHITKNKLLSLVETKQTLEQLILPYDKINILSSTINRLKDPKQFDLSRWGLLSPSLSSNSESLKGCNILLHGYPGTGKTYVAGVIANELGRKLVQVNANNIRDSYYGETEKRVKQLFTKMREIIKSVSPAPVFLLNEGDQLIHSRSSGKSSSTDSTENTIQSIFLEELETFPGILIVTTNLVGNMDIAMSRRFHYKLELGMPDQESQERLWRLHLPASIPGADEIDTICLANEFTLTGGQIRIIVQNACYQAMMRGEHGKLMLDDLCRFAKIEIGSGFGKPAQKVGFSL
ncbi:MAG: ATP-binding protein [Candidatus Cloacimonetes bacterium]|nr:ATP-binding protein [Candidatus Cloacimonadota bacterium]MDY0228588.1 ATP-binding protein [Candidatus Cloacimonadaceae bacterium]